MQSRSPQRSVNLSRRTLLQQTLLQGAATCALSRSARAAQPPLSPPTFAAAAEHLATATRNGQLSAAVMLVRHQGQQRCWTFGKAESPDAIFLLASISKPMTAAVLMTLVDAGALRLEDRASKYLPEFVGEGREQVKLVHLLTHVSGLPDQLPQNAELRARHAPLADFVAGALGVPLQFRPGNQYCYSSMGILLAAEIAQRVSGSSLRELMRDKVFEPLAMHRSALGLGPWSVEQTMRCQVDRAAEESGGGDRSASHWDWNSHYWRDLGAPWGGVHGSAADVAKFLAEFLRPSGRMLKMQTAAQMVRNQLPPQLLPRGLGFGLGPAISSGACSAETFGHTGSTGTLAWADPGSDTICVILTTLPGRALTPHPRALASDAVAAEVV